MATQTVSISLDLPDDCAIESLQSQLLQYARHLIQSDNYRKKNMCTKSCAVFLGKKRISRNLSTIISRRNITKNAVYQI